MSTICMEQSTFFLGLLILIIIYYLFFKNNNKNNIVNEIKEIINTRNTENRNKRDIIIRDYKVLLDELTAPERRIPRHEYPNIQVRQNINVPTRGYPDNYQLMGILMRENTETLYQLFGRQKYPGSSQYEYYVKSGNDDMKNNVKIPLENKNDKEIDDGQTINIPGTDPTKGEFKVKLYKYDLPRYIP